MARAKISRPPSPYPRPIFHTVRIGQTISSIIVMSVLGYFIHWLQVDGFYIPWTFIVLLSVSSFTNLSIFVTSYFYYQRDLKPRLSVWINSFLCALWFLGFALLTWNLSGLLGHECTVENWVHDVGVMVCRIYKALETFTITGMLFTAAALILDINTLSKTTRLGKYNQMNLGDVKHSSGIGSGTASPRFGIKKAGHGMGGFATTGNYRAVAGDADAVEPTLEYPEFSHEVKKPYRVQQVIEAQDFGYALPPEQTTYGGASSLALDRQFADEKHR